MLKIWVTLMISSLVLIITHNNDLSNETNGNETIQSIGLDFEQVNLTKEIKEKIKVGQNYSNKAFNQTENSQNQMEAVFLCEDYSIDEKELNHSQLLFP